MRLIGSRIWCGLMVFSNICGISWVVYWWVQRLKDPMVKEKQCFCSTKCRTYSRNSIKWVSKSMPRSSRHIRRGFIRMMLCKAQPRALTYSRWCWFGRRWTRSLGFVSCPRQMVRWRSCPSGLDFATVTMNRCVTTPSIPITSSARWSQMIT